MTLGEKIKDARHNAGLSQEQLAEKLCVSRAAVAKWETGKGLPDILNLKALAALLDVSIDYLLDDGQKLDLIVTKEAIDWSRYETKRKGLCKQDLVVLERFPNAQRVSRVNLLSGLNVVEEIADALTFGLFELVWGIGHWKEWTCSYFLVEQNSRQYFVRVDQEYITSTGLLRKVEKDRFCIGSNRYLRHRYNLVGK